MIEQAYRLPKNRRWAPNLLSYAPSYKSYLVKKPRKEPEQNPAQRLTIQAGEVASSSSGPRGDLREPLDRETPEPTGLSSEMVQQRAGRNFARRPREAGADAGGSVQQPAPEATERRRKRSEDRAAEVEAGRQEKRVAPEVVDMDADAGVGGSGGSQSTAEDLTAGLKSQWVPIFERVPEGTPITYSDSSADDPSVALGVLRAAALPRDILKVPDNSFASVGRLAQYLAMVSVLSFSIQHLFPLVRYMHSFFLAYIFKLSKLGCLLFAGQYPCLLPLR